MVDLMRKNKRDLVERILFLEDRLERLITGKTDPETLIGEAGSERTHLEARYGALEAAHAEVTAERDRLFREKAHLEERIAALQQDLDDIGGRFHSCHERYQSGFELFKTFVDDGGDGVMLIDATYVIRYVNPLAVTTLGVTDGNSLIGRRIFTFMAFKDALKLKEKIDRVFLHGEREKTGEVRFRAGAVKAEVKMALFRVRYQDAPSIKLVFK